MTTPDTGDTKSNLERLREHLEDGALAAELVDIYGASAPTERPSALKAIAQARLLEIRAKLSEQAASNDQD